MNSYQFSKNPDLRKIPKMEAIPKWLKRNLFNTPLNSILSILILAFVWKAFEQFFIWVFVNGVWIGSANDCRQSSGACVAFIIEKFKFIIFGFYPNEQLWRPILLLLSFVGLLIYSKERSRWNRALFYVWLVFFTLVGFLMRGGIFGIPYVPNDKWGGLPLTLILATVGLVASYPIGIILAMGRRSRMTVVRIFCVCYIELIRGVPLISLLFMASVMFPLFLPEEIVVDKLLRAQIAIILFIAAYMAEVVRGALAAIPKGQYEAAESLGLNYFQTMGGIILPQALKMVIPPTVNTAIGMFKDTSLVLIIALFDLLNTTKSALRDSHWLGFSVEAYIFVALIYFIFCFSMSRYSRRLEREFRQEC